MRSVLVIAVLCLETAVATGAARVRSMPVQPPLEVVASDPAQDAADVRRDAPIRVTFSRDVDAASLDGRVVVRYSAAESAERGEPQPPALAFRLRYDREDLTLEIAPSQPLERFREVQVELLDGITGVRGGVLTRWVLTFRTGGR